ncbi:flagellar hook assembly protein FlgD [Methylobacterium sp. WSM2598]|uniref:flagellar hook assembly protein FlgD n=1 Tax=Methylobacterium sp. WSM2598 TaxID=398261 RepID=UPI0003640934|nr:flagellar hook assembly protein FlgD [Methylobacterium sp. WSM2598]
MSITGISSSTAGASSGATATGGSAAPTTSKTATSLNTDAFLQLLLTQLKNQDPTKPMDSTAYMGELATFSEVEQSTKMNNKLDALLSSNYLAQAESAIGRTATSDDGKITGVVASVKITTDGPLATLKDGRQLLLGNGVSLS